MTNKESVVYYNVSFEDKETAKKVGMKFDPKIKVWYGPPGLQFFKPVRQIFLDMPMITDSCGRLVFQMENRDFGENKVHPELIPSSMWNDNVRFVIGAGEWSLVRLVVLGRANWKCEFCGEEGADAHEMWSFHPFQREQRLERFVCVCDTCHKIIHFGQACEYGDANMEELLSRYMTKTGQSRKQAEDIFRDAFRLWEKRSKYKWRINFGFFQPFCSS